MRKDSVDELVEQWRQERPELDVAGLGLAVRIDRVAKLQRRRAESSLADFGLKTWEYDVLSALRRQGASYELPATDLAKATLLTSGAMTTRIDGLEARRLVLRVRDREDRRGVHVRLTRKGLELIDKAIKARLAAAEKTMECLSGKERITIERVLRKLLLCLDEQDSEKETKAR